MRILGTNIEYDTLTKTDRNGAFWLLLRDKRVVRVIKSPSSKEFAMHSRKTNEIFMAVWDTKEETFRISRNGERLPADADMYYSVSKLIKQVASFSKGKRKVFNFNMTPELQQALAQEALRKRQEERSKSGL